MRLDRQGAGIGGVTGGFWTMVIFPSRGSDYVSSFCNPASELWSNINSGSSEVGFSKSLGAVSSTSSRDKQSD